MFVEFLFCRRLRIPVLFSLPLNGENYDETFSYCFESNRCNEAHSNGEVKNVKIREGGW